MERAPAAVGLARALLALGRSEASGVLEVRSEGRRAEIAIVAGTPRAVRIEDEAGSFEDETLGDALVRSGAMDGEAHLRALESAEDGAPSEPVGEWLVRMGAATSAAVSHALRAQLRKRVARLLAWPAAEYRFVAGHSDVAVAHLEEPMSSAELVLAAMRDLVAGEPAVRARRVLGDGMLVMTALGQALLGEPDMVALWPDEAAMLPALKQGAVVDVVLAGAKGSARALRLLLALRWLGAVAPPGLAGAAYTTLLRKKRQLRRKGTQPHALLDLPQRAPRAEARKALRKLATQVHPDRFASDPAVVPASEAVMSALTRAADALKPRNA